VIVATDGITGAVPGTGRMSIRFQSGALSIRFEGYDITKA